MGWASVEVWPSPKLHKYELFEPVELFEKTAESPACCELKAATGGAATVIVFSETLEPAAFVAVIETENAPA